MAARVLTLVDQEVAQFRGDLRELAHRQSAQVRGIAIAASSGYLSIATVIAVAVYTLARAAAKVGYALQLARLTTKSASCARALPHVPQGSQGGDRRVAQLAARRLAAASPAVLG